MDNKQQKWIKEYPVVWFMLCKAMDAVLFFVKVWVCIEIVRLIKAVMAWL